MAGIRVVLSASVLTHARSVGYFTRGELNISFCRKGPGVASFDTLVSRRRKVGRGEGIGREFYALPERG